MILTLQGDDISIESTDYKCTISKSLAEDRCNYYKQLFEKIEYINIDGEDVPLNIIKIADDNIHFQKETAITPVFLPHLTLLSPL